MPRIQRSNLPRALFAHLLDRIKTRNISADQLGLLAEWLDTKPEVPVGEWFKKFSGMTVCAGELIILDPNRMVRVNSKWLTA